MNKKSVLKCVLLTASFFVLLCLYYYAKAGSFSGFVENTDFPFILSLSVLGLLAYIFKMGFRNFFGYPEKSYEEKMLPDQGSQNFYSGPAEEYIICEICQKASIDKNEELTQCPLCKAKFAQGELITE